MQEQFVKYLRTKFNDDLDAMNQAFGLDYWSNRINAWEDFPDVRGINQRKPWRRVPEVPENAGG